jgi:hypothetical protein
MFPGYQPLLHRVTAAAMVQGGLGASAVNRHALPPPPVFCTSVDSEWFSDCVSLLDATLADISISVDSAKDRGWKVEKKQLSPCGRDDIACVDSVAWGTPHPHLIAEECATD